jgi:selenocysteine lyase/cysteine desulfurase
VVAFTLASNAVGTLTPAPDIARRAHAVGALAWADAVAYAPHRRIDVAALGCDVLLCSPYKFFGPHLGMSWLRPDLAESLPAERVRPAANKPAGHRFETGTLSHEALAGFVAAIEYLTDPAGDQPIDHDDPARVAAALDRTYSASQAWETSLAERLLGGVSGLPGVRVAGPAVADPEARVGTFGLMLDGPDVAATARALGGLGIYTWNGDFYATGVVDHLGLQDRGGLLRAGIVHYNSTDDVDRFVTTLAELVSPGSAA